MGATATPLRCDTCQRHFRVSTGLVKVMIVTPVENDASLYAQVRKTYVHACLHACSCAQVRSELAAAFTRLLFRAHRLQTAQEPIRRADRLGFFFEALDLPHTGSRSQERVKRLEPVKTRGEG